MSGHAERRRNRLTGAGSPALGGHRAPSAAFGVTPAQAGASIFPRFNASSGFKDVRAGANLIYRINSHWFVGTDVGVTRLLGDAALSPISIRDTNVTVMGMAGYRF